MPASNTQSAPQGELEYHERIYSGFAQQHFAKGALRAFRAHLARRYLPPGSGRPRVPSLCKLSSNFEILAEKGNQT